jgi:predicted MPP superfamily phosphohydrolase
MSDDVRFLFRFRDLVADTVAEHRKTVAAHGSVWWGWWKRPSEDVRLDVWQALKNASPAAPVRIGLFDSGQGVVFPATLTGAIPPRPDGDRVAVTDGEQDLIPAYYRDGSFSRAWMRLSDIGDPMEFFGRYSFAEPPKLPGYDPKLLTKFAGKVIRSADELRAMDTTIWIVRPRVPGQDRDEQILVTTPGIASALSAEPVSCESEHVLHITDPHFSAGATRTQHVWRLEGEDVRRFSLAEAVTAALAKEKISRLACMVVTGDLTFRADPAEFAAASAALRVLCGNFNLRPDQVVIVPGNHDMAWTRSDTYSHDAVVSEAPVAARRNYEQFYHNFFGHEPGKYLSMARRYALPSGAMLEICALNSSSLEQGKNFLAGMGRVEEEAFSETARELGWGGRETLALRILALHHHLALTEDLEPASGYAQGFGLAVDAPRVLRMAAESGVQLALHGHKHRAFIWRSGVYQLPEYTRPAHRLGSVSIVGGGSAGSSEVEAESNFFNLLSVRPDGVALRFFRSQREGVFEPVLSYRAPFSLNPQTRHLDLLDWEATS